LAQWEQYSAGLPSASLELRVAQRALRDGCSAKEVALMLVAGSETVRQIHDAQGKQEVIAFAKHITQIAINPEHASQNKAPSLQRRQFELGDS
jgi:hypothetical protein